MKNIRVFYLKIFSFQFLGVKFSIYFNRHVFIMNDSNINGAFIVADLNLFFSPKEILPIAQSNKYLVIFYENVLSVS